MNIFIGNLSFDVSEDDLQKAFEAYGQVSSVNIIKDKYSGRSRGFGFVEMGSETEAQAAIDGLNEKELKGRKLSVNQARERSNDRRPGGGGGGGGGPRRGRPGGGGGGGGRRY